MTAARGHPYDVIARVLAERLQGCEASAELRARVLSQDIDWARVIGLASAQFVLPAFAAGLRDLDLLDPLNNELGAFLEAVHAANLERNAELRDELAAVLGVLNRADIQPVLLKGALRLIDGLYPDDGWRMLRDLDLLIPESAVAKAIRELESAGYASSGSENAVRRRGGLCQIDLHSELFSGSTQLRLLQAGTVLNGSSSFAMEQWSVRIPSIEDQLVHLIGHSQIRHRGYAMGKIGFRDLLEAAALVQWGRQSIDWRAVSARFDAAGYHRPLLAFLLALNEVPWCTVPAMGRIDDLTALQQYRIRVQARSGPFGYIGSRAGWWLSEFRSQIRERDAGQLRAIKNLRRLVSEPGAISRMAQAFCDRKADLMHILPPLILLCAP